MHSQPGSRSAYRGSIIFEILEHYEKRQRALSLITVIMMWSEACAGHL
jgi:hypothetical protein